MIKVRADTIKNTEALSYQIGRFILDAKESDDLLFAKIEIIARGAMIASAIYIDTSNTPSFVKERRLTNLSVYFDTAFVLSALNYKRTDQKLAADTLLDMLRENGASLFAATVAAKADAAQAKQERDAASQKLISNQSRIKCSIGTLRKSARENADNRAKKTSGRIKSGIITILVIIMFMSAVATFFVGINSSHGKLALFVALISGISAATLWIPLIKAGAHLQNKLFNKLEGPLYVEELARVAPQIQVLEALLKDDLSDI